MLYTRSRQYLINLGWGMSLGRIVRLTRLSRLRHEVWVKRFWSVLWCRFTSVFSLSPCQELKRVSCTVGDNLSPAPLSRWVKLGVYATLTR